MISSTVPSAFPVPADLDGFWMFDQVHAPRPLTPLSQSLHFGRAHSRSYTPQFVSSISRWSLTSMSSASESGCRCARAPDVRTKRKRAERDDSSELDTKIGVSPNHHQRSDAACQVRKRCAGYSCAVARSSTMLNVCSPTRSQWFDSMRVPLNDFRSSSRRRTRCCRRLDRARWHPRPRRRRCPG
jgi:hypothetical protein